MKYRVCIAFYNERVFKALLLSAWNVGLKVGSVGFSTGTILLSLCYSVALVVPSWLHLYLFFLSSFSEMLIVLVLEHNNL